MKIEGGMLNTQEEEGEGRCGGGGEEALRSLGPGSTNQYRIVVDVSGDSTPESFFRSSVVNIMISLPVCRKQLLS